MEYEVGKRLDELEFGLLEVHKKLFPERYKDKKNEEKPKAQEEAKKAQEEVDKGEEAKKE